MKGTCSREHQFRTTHAFLGASNSLMTVGLIACAHTLACRLAASWHSASATNVLKFLLSSSPQKKSWAMLLIKDLVKQLQMKNTLKGNYLTLNWTITNAYPQHIHKMQNTQYFQTVNASLKMKRAMQTEVHRQKFCASGKIKTQLGSLPRNSKDALSDEVIFALKRAIWGYK